jgi:hypothetical protein
MKDDGRLAVVVWWRFAIYRICCYLMATREENGIESTSMLCCGASSAALNNAAYSLSAIR